MDAADALDRDALLALGRHLLEQGYHFITPTPATHARVNVRPANTWAVDARGVLGWSRPLRADGPLADLLALMQRAGIARPCPRTGGWRSTLRASTLGGQLYFHSAYPTEGQDDVFFGPDTYRFVRALLAAPEQEYMRERANPRRIIDIGSGAAPAAIALALRYPDAEVIAADINPRAMLLAELNAQLAGAAGLQVVRSDVLDGVEGRFDLIVANPPYMADDQERAYRDGGDDLGASLSERIAVEAAARLAPGGMLQLYTGSAIVDGRDALRERTGAQLDGAGFAWTYEELDPDVFGEELERPAYAGVERIAAVLLTVTNAASKGGPAPR